MQFICIAAFHGVSRIAARTFFGILLITNNKWDPPCGYRAGLEATHGQYFLPLIFRMRYINRWSLMFNTEQEDLMQHTAECAFLVHFLATIGNRCFEKQYDADKLAVCALFHDAPEVLTGDLPTPVKYYNDEMKTIYKQIEKTLPTS